MWGAVWVAMLVLQGGCYYTHLASGQTRVLMARTSIEEMLEDPETPEALRRDLEVVERARTLARELDLEVGEQYTSFVPWPSDRIVTTVVATPPRSVDPENFWFPVVGHVPYKGFFDPARADNEAKKLAKRGLDTCTFAIDAYSTLGFLDDPVTQPMLGRSEGELVETLVHELVHATFYVKSQPDFNEGAAQFVGQEAAARYWSDDVEAVARERDRIADRRRLAASLLEFRERVRALYGDTAHLEVAEVTTRRADIEAGYRLELAALPLASGNAEALSADLRLNDACLALRGTYGGDMPLHQRKLRALGGNLRNFIAALRTAAETEDPRATFFGGIGATDTATR